MIESDVEFDCAIYRVLLARESLQHVQDDGETMRAPHFELREREDGECIEDTELSQPKNQKKKNSKKGREQANARRGRNR